MKWKLQFLDCRFYFTFNFSCKRILWAVNFKLFYGVTVINVCSPLSARFYSFWEFCFEFHKNRMPKSEIQVFRGHSKSYFLPEFQRLIHIKVQIWNKIVIFQLYSKLRAILMAPSTYFTLFPPKTRQTRVSSL